MPADLTGLTQPRKLSSASAPFGVTERLDPLVDYSKLLLQETFPGGKAGVPEEKLTQEFSKRMWGTGTSPGFASQFARVGLNELQTPFQYEFGRQMREAEQQLKDQYQQRQINALNAYKTAAMTELEFGLREG